MDRYKIVFTIFFLFVLPASSPAYDAQPRCFKQLQTRFFRDTTVSLALSQFQVPQSQWISIRNDLKEEGYRIPKIMKERARRLRPDPLQNPFQAEAALQLFRQIAWEIFTEVMTKYDDGFQKRKWPFIFDFIYETELRHLNACLTRVARKQQ